jgi:alkylated DNA repair dioxygenase AlkB
MNTTSAPLFCHTNPIHHHDGTIFYKENYVPYQIAELKEGVVWRNDSITFWGKTYPQPRLTAWHGDPGVEYKYSNIKMISPGWTPLLKSIRDQLFADLNISFNSVLINLYRDGNDHMSYHSDDEKSLGLNPTIASLSFGSTRKFLLKHRYKKEEKTISFNLESQSLLVMQDELQHFWLHKIAKNPKEKSERLNLTYRQIKIY